MIQRLRLVSAASWLAGVVGLVAMVLYFQPARFGEALQAVGFGGGLVWLLLTLLSRLALVEVTVRPLALLGHPLARSDAFWIGWVRTFSNQVLPLSGLALYAHQVRRKTGLSWTAMVSLSSPQFLLAAVAIGMLGLMAVLSSWHALGPAASALLVAFGVVTAGAVLVATNAAWFIERLPRVISKRAGRVAASFRTLASSGREITILVALHCGAVLFRGSRLLVLFAAVGEALGWREALLLLAVAESSMLIQLTPGGLALREGAVVGAALLVQISAEVGVMVALIDRLLVVCVTVLLAIPGFIFLHRNDSAVSPGIDDQHRTTR